ncbi:MAG: SPOR domain-containing protein [Aquificaceae bacterium]|nr:SPOR domain-containing protein [Aquificaceae bacterium]
MRVKVKRERLIILLGVLIALVFFYLGLNEWLKTREERVQPPPLVVKPTPQPKEPPLKEGEAAAQKEEKPPAEQKDIAEKTPQKEVKGEAPEEKKEEPPQKAAKKEQKDLIAQKIKEERLEGKQKEPKAKVQEKADMKVYTVQIGAFKDRERAKKVAERAKGMGYEVKLVEEEDFYKVRLTLRTDSINTELGKLKKTFGGAILKQ